MWGIHPVVAINSKIVSRRKLRWCRGRVKYERAAIAHNAALNVMLSNDGQASGRHAKRFAADLGQRRHALADFLVTQIGEAQPHAAVRVQRVH